jgi:hypothetical protein
MFTKIDLLGTIIDNQSLLLVSDTNVEELKVLFYKTRLEISVEYWGFANFSQIYIYKTHIKAFCKA